MHSLYWLPPLDRTLPHLNLPPRKPARQVSSQLSYRFSLHHLLHGRTDKELMTFLVGQQGGVPMILQHISGESSHLFHRKALRSTQGQPSYFVGLDDHDCVDVPESMMTKSSR